MREGATLMHFESLNKCYMYGGIGRDLFNNIVILNLKNWNWESIGPGSGDAPSVGRFFIKIIIYSFELYRFGHSSHLYKNNILIFGGERKYNTTMKMRECYGDIRLYSPLDHNW